MLKTHYIDWQTKKLVEKSFEGMKAHA